MAGNLPNWISKLIAVVATAAFALVLVWTGIVYAETNQNRDRIEKLTVRQAVVERDLQYLVKGIDSLKISINRLEDKLGTRPATK